MSVQRIGSDRLRAMQAARLPKSPEYLRRRTDRQRAGSAEDRGKQRTLDPETMEPPCTVRLVCPEHDVLVKRFVQCRHDLRELVDEVADAHAAPFGGRCGMSLRTWFGDGQES